MGQNHNKMGAAALGMQHVLNQSVLLANINADANTLIELSTKLFAQGVLPYYLHTLDKVTGSAHFDVDNNEIKLNQHELLTQLPGYLVPKIVTDGIDLAFKQPIK